MDTSLIGETAARMMESLDDFGEEADLVSVGIVVVVDPEPGNDEGSTYTRIKCSEKVWEHRVGLFRGALAVLADDDDSSGD